jgi:hypothetical protein
MRDALKALGEDEEIEEAKTEAEELKPATLV